jgi:hypothetical protein
VYGSEDDFAPKDLDDATPELGLHFTRLAESNEEPKKIFWHSRRKNKKRIQRYPLDGELFCGTEDNPYDPNYVFVMVVHIGSKPARIILDLRGLSPAKTRIPKFWALEPGEAGEWIVRLDPDGVDNWPLLRLVAWDDSQSHRRDSGISSLRGRTEGGSAPPSPVIRMKLLDDSPIAGRVTYR